MNLTELAHETHIASHTIRYYVVQGLVPPPTTSAQERDGFGATHMERLRVVHALVEHAGISVSEVARVIAALDSGSTSVDRIVALALSLSPSPYADDPVCGEIRVLMRELDWHLPIGSPMLSTLSATVAKAREAGVALDQAQLVKFGSVAEQIASLDLDSIRRTCDPLEAVANIAVATALLDDVFATLRRMAQMVVASRTPGDGTSAE